MSTVFSAHALFWDVVKRRTAASFMPAPCLMPISSPSVPAAFCQLPTIPGLCSDRLFRQLACCVWGCLLISLSCNRCLGSRVFPNIHSVNLWNRFLWVWTSNVARTPRIPAKKSRAAEAKGRGRAINLLGQQQPAKADKLLSAPEDGDDEAPHPRPGLPVTQGEFPIAHAPEPEAPGKQAAPDSNADSDATIDYENQVFRQRMCFSLSLKVNLSLTFLF